MDNSALRRQVIDPCRLPAGSSSTAVVATTALTVCPPAGTGVAPKEPGSTCTWGPDTTAAPTDNHIQAFEMHSRRRDFQRDKDSFCLHHLTTARVLGPRPVCDFACATVGLARELQTAESLRTNTCTSTRIWISSPGDGPGRPGLAGLERRASDGSRRGSSMSARMTAARA